MTDQRPKSVQSGFRSKSQPSLSVKTGYSGKSSGSIAGSGKPTAPKLKPEWDSNTQQNPAEHRETEEERSQRAASHVSKNLKVAQRELEEKKIRNGKGQGPKGHLASTDSSDRLIDRLIDCSIARSIDWSIDWLIDRSFDWLIDCLDNSCSILSSTDSWFSELTFSLLQISSIQAHPRKSASSKAQWWRKLFWAWTKSPTWLTNPFAFSMKLVSCCGNMSVAIISRHEVFLWMPEFQKLRVLNDFTDSV